MRYCLLAAIVVVGCGQKNREYLEPESGEEPPLLLEEGNSEEELAGWDELNNRCYVCHINYADEDLTVTHARADVGCEQCHGACDAHCSDEDNVTPPDIMYPRSKVNSFCMGCHPKDQIDIQPHEAVFEATAGEKKYCTDCHGEHRLSYRTRRWDKSTGELVEDDKVRMMTEGVPRQR